MSYVQVGAYAGVAFRFGVWRFIITLMREIKWTTGIGGVISFLVSIGIRRAFGWGDWIFILPIILLAICLGILIAEALLKLLKLEP